MRHLIFLVLLFSPARAQDRQVVAISHRGEHLRHPENTMPAYRAALEGNADFIETDVRTTSDGKLVIMHDVSVDRRTNGHGEVAKMTFGDIRKLDAGIKSGEQFANTQVPTFDEVLAFARGRIGVYIDAKHISGEALVTAVVSHGMEDHVVVYGGLDLHRDVRRLNPRIKIMPEASSLDVATRIVEELLPKVMAFDAHDFKEDIIGVALKAKTGIFVDRLGPADTPESWEDAVRRGATGIQSDHPAELVQFLRSRGWHK